MKVTALIAATLFVISAHANETAPAHKGHGAAATAPATTTTTTTTEAAAPAKDCKALKGKAKKACMDEQKAAAAAPTTATETH